MAQPCVGPSGRQPQPRSLAHWLPPMNRQVSSDKAGWCVLHGVRSLQTGVSFTYSRPLPFSSAPPGCAVMVGRGHSAFIHVRKWLSNSTAALPSNSSLCHVLSRWVYIFRKQGENYPSGGAVHTDAFTGKHFFFLLRWRISARKSRHFIAPRLSIDQGHYFVYVLFLYLMWAFLFLLWSRLFFCFTHQVKCYTVV